MREKSQHKDTTLRLRLKLESFIIDVRLSWPFGNSKIKFEGTMMLPDTCIQCFPQHYLKAKPTLGMFITAMTISQDCWG